MSWWNLETPNGEKLRIIPGRIMANNVRYSWNEAVKQILETGDEWVLSSHNDVVLHPKTLTRLMSWDLPIVSALVFMRQSPVVPHIWQAYNGTGQMANRIQDTRDWLYQNPARVTFGPYVEEPRPSDALAPVDFTSTSCVLIHRKVFEDMREAVQDKWFEWDDDYKGGGEDRKFFTAAKQAGHQAFVDRSCMIGHIVGEVPTSAADFIAWDSVSEFNGTGEPPDPMKIRDLDK